MAPLPHPPLPKAARSRFGNNFDPWNSSATGHQRAEARAITSGTGWRDMRNRQLQNQYLGKTQSTNTAGAGTGPKMSVMEMLVNPGSMVPKTKTKTQPASESEPQPMPKPMPTSSTRITKKTTDGRHNGTNASSTRHGAGREVMVAIAEREHVAAPAKQTTEQTEEQTEEQAACDDDGWYTPQEMDELGRAAVQGQHEQPPAAGEYTTTSSKRGIFDGLVVYVNGSTFPAISDHRLKQLLAEHGASMSSHVARRQVTHIILGRPNANGRGAGGGLAGAKLEKEIRKAGGRPIKYVNVEWVIESVEAGKRLPEARFTDLKIAASAQKSVYPMVTKMGGAPAQSQTKRPSVKSSWA